MSSRLGTKLQENILKPLAHDPSLGRLSGSGSGMGARPILVIIITYFERDPDAYLLDPAA